MYIPTIGLEIHVELKTETKMFCGCSNKPDEKKPNFNVCPVCLAHPGTLPTINKKAVEAVLKSGMALGGKISGHSKFDRKNYFYPDLPKGYQISQYDEPLVSGGELKGIKIRRIHLEEDTARLMHSPDGKFSLVDFNRAGIPLMELVTEPEIKNGKEAVSFAKELRLILKYLDISDADMEKGHMRVEANLSVSADHNLGTKVEVKNLNSFRAVEEAIDYEIKRQTEILSASGGEKGEKIVQETRGWDENKKITVSQRIKEEAHDYRYFPEPDLPPLDLGEFRLEEMKAEMPELPEQKRTRFPKEYDLSPEQAEILVVDFRLAEYFEESVSELFSEISEEKNKRESVQLLFNYLVSDLKGLLNEKGLSVGDLKISPENFSDLIVLIAKGEISSRLAKDILREMAESGLDPRRIIGEKNLSRISDEKVIEQAVGEVIAQNGKAVEDYRKGKESAVQFLIGQSMKKSGGRVDPLKIKEIIDRLLKDA